jgi:ABC-type antimicrobial peptide transport system permease subunit
MYGLSSEMIIATTGCVLIIMRLWRMFLVAALFLAIMMIILGILSFVSYIGTLCFRSYPGSPDRQNSGVHISWFELQADLPPTIPQLERYNQVCLRPRWAVVEHVVMPHSAQAMGPAMAPVAIAQH